MCTNVQSQARRNWKQMHCATNYSSTVKVSKTEESLFRHTSEAHTNGALARPIGQTQTLITNIPCLLVTNIFNILQIVEKINKCTSH